MSLLLLLVGGAVFSGAAGSGLSRSVLALCLSAAVALHIHLGRGTLEFHFGVFVDAGTAARLPRLAADRGLGGLLRGAPRAFDRMQAAGMGVYCTPEPNFLKIVMHAGYVVLQTALEVLIAVRMAAIARQGDELRCW